MLFSKQKQKIVDSKFGMLPWWQQSLSLLSAISVSGLGLVFLFVPLTRFGAFGKLADQQNLQNLSSQLATEIYSADGALIGKYFHKICSASE